MKRVGTYLLSHPRVVFEYARVPERDVQRIVGYSDSDWAGCKANRRSMSGGMMSLRGPVIEAWSNRQASVALSSREAEYYSACKAAATGVAMQSVLNDLGWHAEIHIKIDASAARSMATHQGIGRCGTCKCGICGCKLWLRPER